MNDLRQNIKSFTPLDVTKQDNPILKALAAFILYSIDKKELKEKVRELLAELRYLGVSEEELLALLREGETT